ncbi:hypothetical protein Xen7305DRAFT_00046310 [Xenococcus sp. PCC 7305]|uniref:hypothetical protein n=1 Tax=Xenococcus sp. PCC 7305 TaxID=102125 RepID=UPI0002AC668F|nr:hypothetical protein [Xenococcus sp. PCC 7305]ELS04895.1 hypothetical protein Xen7305DRAFT_00046310 [Xenococcus sp. PCC 7305]
MNKEKWWKISNSISLLFLVLIGSMWLHTTRKYQPNENELSNKTEVDKYLLANFSNLPTKRIPTGVFIESLKFNNSTEVNVTGYIWQIYDRSQYKDIPGDEIPVGFILPEAVNSGDNIDPTFAYRDHTKDNKEVIGWYFETTLKQLFDYSKYPFDHKVVWIRFWSRDFERKTILVPSFDSYKSTELNDAFGYDQKIVLDHWELLETFFDYRKQSYNTNFGFTEERFDNQPELYFNIVIKRHFFNSFVIYILPLIIIACLVFATLMMITKNEEQSSLFGLNTSDVIEVCAGLFFVVLLSQVQIREQFAGSRIVYLEFFYPLMYVNLLGVSVNSYIFSRINTENNLILKWINYEDNIIPKLIYWPTLLGCSALITAVVLLPNRHHLPSLNNNNQSFLIDKKTVSKITVATMYLGES